MPFVIDKSKSKKEASILIEFAYSTEVLYDIFDLPFVQTNVSKTCKASIQFLIFCSIYYSVSLL